MNVSAIFDSIATILQLAGATTIGVGVVVAVVVACVAWRRTRSPARGLGVLRAALGSAILLGLEVLVAADLIHTVTSSPSLVDALVLALVVLIRTVLSFSLHVELDGVVPWRRRAAERSDTASDKSTPPLPDRA